jgi:hypothetical protein
MKKIFVVGILSIAACSQSVLADDLCVPASAVVCSIDSSGQYTNATYTLKTTFEIIKSIVVQSQGPNAVWGQADPVLGKAALAQLETQAQELKKAGVCAIVINNIE